MADILTMARSFGSFFYFLRQNLSTAVPDARILEPRWGGRVTRTVYETQIEGRDAEWRGEERNIGQFEDNLEKAYEKEREVCRV
jgi:hypothetical protein